MVIISKTQGIESLGVFSLALALTAPLMLFSNFGMRILWVTNTFKYAKFSDFRVVRLCFSLSGAAITCLFLSLYLPSSNYLSIYVLVVASKLVENNADIFYSRYHRNGEQKQVSKSLIIRGFLGVGGMWVGCFVFDDFFGGVFLYTLMWLLSHIFTEQTRTPFPIQELRDLRAYSKIMRDVTLKGVPIAIGLFLANLNMNLPRIQLEREFDLETVGIYSALYFFIQTGSVIVTSIGQAILPQLSGFYNGKNNTEHLSLVAKVLGVIVFMAVVAAFICLFIGDFVLTALFDDTVAARSSTLALFFLLSPAQYSVSILNVVIASVKRNSIVMWCQILMFLIVSILSCILVPKSGVVGAYFSYGMSSAVISLIYFCLYFKVIRCNN